MTDQVDRSEYFDDVDRLSAQLEYVQTLHGQALRDLQESEGKLLDKSTYNAKRKVLTEAHQEASQTLIKTIEDTKEAMRKQVALDLLYAGESETERRAWDESIRLVEGARTIEQQEELVHRALRWGDKALARALVFKFGGRPEYKAMHEVLSGVDPRIKKSFDWERKHGTYKKKDASSQTWAGWQTLPARGAGSIADIPGRPDHLQPSYLIEQKRQRIAKMRAGQ